MAAKQIKVDVVSPEGEMYSGNVSQLSLRGTEGELGISPGHLQLLTTIAPGPLRLIQSDGEEELLFVSGGILEVQPDHATILADTVERPQDVNEAAAQKAKEDAEAMLDGKKAGAKDFHEAQANLAEAMARLQVLELMRLRKKR